MASDKTTTAILDTAERLFAERGFDGVSVREITREAGVNVAAVHYHFGSKDAVLRGVTGRVAETIAARRLALLDELVARDSSPSLEAVMRAFIRPDIEVLQELQDRGPTVARFLGRVYLDQTRWIQEMAMEQFGPSSLPFLGPIRTAVPHLDEDIVQRRMRRVGVVLAHAFATWPASGMTAADARELLEDLVAFCAAAVGARAPTASRG